MKISLLNSSVDLAGDKTRDMSRSQIIELELFHKMTKSSYRRKHTQQQKRYPELVVAILYKITVA